MHSQYSRILKFSPPSIQELTLSIPVMLIGLSCFGQEPVLFLDRAQEKGLDYVYDGLITDGSGINFMDFNDDGIDDISIGTSTGLQPKFYRLQGDSLIIEELEGFEFETEGSRAMNWIDYDNDGDKDLSITNVNSIVGFPVAGVQKLYNRLNDSVLVDMTYQSGWSLEPFPAYCSAWADYNNDGWLDCYISQRLDLTNSRNYLYRSNGDGTFEEVAADLGVHDIEGMTYQAVFFDYDLDGDVDLFTANDKWVSPNSFFENNGDGTFTDISYSSGLMTYMEGMGVSIGDFDNNGYLDLLVANSYSIDPELDSGNKLFLNSGEGTFTDIAEEIGAEGNNTVWGINLFDVDNDMDLDIFMVSSGGSSSEAQQLLFNNDGQMEILSDGSFDTAVGPSFGTALGDINSDGLYDIAVANNITGKHQLWYNQIENENHWIKFNLEGSISNRDGIGSLVEIWTDGWKQIRFTTCGNSYGSQDSDTYIVGLGTNPQVDSLIVHWPSGYENVLYNLPPERRYDIIENIEYSVIECLPDADFNADQLSNYQFNLNAQTIDSASDYSWDLGNGEIINGPNINYTFSEAGTYQICLTVTNNCSWNSSCLTLEIECLQPQSNFDWQANELQVEFISTSAIADSLIWYLNGTEIELTNSIYNFEGQGEYNVCLVAFNSCGSDTICHTIELTCSSPESNFSFEIINFSLQLTSNSTDADSLLWILNGEELPTLVDSSIEFNSEGVYELCLVAINACSSDTVCQLISIKCPSPQANFSVSAADLNIEIENLSTNYDSLSWYLGNGIVFQGTLNQYSYALAGDYSICLNAYNSCGQDSICISVTLVNPPTGLDNNSTVIPSVYPIPTSDYLYVILPYSDAYLENISLYTLDGRLVEIPNPKNWNNGNSKVTLDLINTHSGMYLLKIGLSSHVSTIPIIKE